MHACIVPLGYFEGLKETSSQLNSTEASKQATWLGISSLPSTMVSISIRIPSLRTNYPTRVFLVLVLFLFLGGGSRNHQ